MSYTLKDSYSTYKLLARKIYLLWIIIGVILLIDIDKVMTISIYLLLFCCLLSLINIIRLLNVNYYIKCYLAYNDEKQKDIVNIHNSSIMFYKNNLLITPLYIIIFLYLVYLGYTNRIIYIAFLIPLFLDISVFINLLFKKAILNSLVTEKETMRQLIMID